MDSVILGELISDANGQLFISACVIPHMWHEYLVEYIIDRAGNILIHTYMMI